MFTSIVIGFDGDRGGRDALALAQRLASPDAKLTIVHVWSELEGIASVALGTEYPTDAAHDLLAESQRLAGVHCDVLVRRARSVGDGLHQVARELGADLIVVGASERDLIDRVLLGDRARAALRGAPCVVAMAQSGEADRERPIRKVGLAYEPESGRGAIGALETARAVATGLGAQLHAMHVIAAVPHPAPDDPVAYARHLAESAESRTERARRELQRLGHLTAHVGQGDTVQQLCDFAASVDLLVIGSRDHGSATGMLLGSIGARVARQSQTSLLITPRMAPLATTVLMPVTARSHGAA